MDERLELTEISHAGNGFVSFRVYRLHWDNGVRVQLTKQGETVAILPVADSRRGWIVGMEWIEYTSLERCRELAPIPSPEPPVVDENGKVVQSAEPEEVTYAVYVGQVPTMEIKNFGTDSTAAYRYAAQQRQRHGYNTDAVRIATFRNHKSYCRRCLSEVTDKLIYCLMHDGSFMCTDCQVLTRQRFRMVKGGRVYRLVGWIPARPLSNYLVAQRVLLVRGNGVAYDWTDCYSSDAVVPDTEFTYK